MSCPAGRVPTGWAPDSSEGGAGGIAGHGVSGPGVLQQPRRVRVGCDDAGVGDGESEDGTAGQGDLSGAGAQAGIPDLHQPVPSRAAEPRPGRDDCLHPAPRAHDRILRNAPDVAVYQHLATVRRDVDQLPRAVDDPDRVLLAAGGDEREHPLRAGARVRGAQNDDGPTRSRRRRQSLGTRCGAGQRARCQDGGQEGRASHPGPMDRHHQASCAFWIANESSSWPGFLVPPASTVVFAVARSCRLRALDVPWQ